MYSPLRQQIWDTCEHYIRNATPWQHARQATSDCQRQWWRFYFFAVTIHGQSATSSLLLSRYSDLSYDTSQSNEQGSTSARTRSDSCQESSTLGCVNNSNRTPSLSQFSCDENYDEIDTEGALATVHDYQ